MAKMLLIEISNEILTELLRLPPNVQVAGVSGYDGQARQTEIILTGDGLPEKTRLGHKELAKKGNIIMRSDRVPVFEKFEVFD